MVAVFNKGLLSWYLITLKLRETIESRIQRSSTDQQEPLQQQQKQEAAPTESVQVVIKEVAENGTRDLEEAKKSTEADWIVSIREKLEQAHQDDAEGSWGKISIYRIPHYLRDDDKAYVPQTVSVGPYHHGKKRLRQMDRHKWRSLDHVLKRSRQDIRVYIDAMKEMEERVRSCYEGLVVLSSNEFVEMLVLDGCFVLELFQGAAVGFKELGYDRNDPVFAIRGSMHSIHRDMIMLENQLPLFALDRLLGIQLGDPAQKGRVAQLTLIFFDPLMPTDDPLTKSDINKLNSSLGSHNNAENFDPLSDLSGMHCLDVFRRNLLQTGLKADLKIAPKIWMKRQSHVNRIADKRRMQLIHCVTELKGAGINCKKRKTDRFWDIKFKNGVLWIPRLLIHDGTKSLFLNLIAFEQCHLDCSNDITSYVIFMDNLINSQEDVGYLHYCGIIEHWLGNDAEVADLFSRLCQEVVFDIHNSYLSHLYEDINRYYNQRWNTWRGTLKHKYFNNPWAIVSFFAAAVLLVLTFAQTFYGVYGYYRPI